MQLPYLRLPSLAPWPHQQMAWDGPYTSAADQLRLLPAQAVEALTEWAHLCQAWQVWGCAG